MTIRMMCPIMAVFLIIVNAAIAEVFYVEAKSLTSIPKSADSAIRQAEIKLKDLKKCKFVGQKINLAGEGNKEDFIVTTKGSCLWSAGAAPIWVLRKYGNAFIPVLKMVSHSVTFSNSTTNGLRDITLTRGSAGYAEVEKWAYDGQRYQKGKSIFFDASDTETCKAHPDICPFDIQK